MYRLIMVIGVVAATCFALGCGSSSSEGTSASETASAPLTKAQFIKQADAICKKVSRERSAAFVSWQEKLPPGAAETEAQSDKGIKEVIVPSIQRELEELKGLAPPEKDKAKISRIFEALSNVNKSFEEQGVKGIASREISRFEQEAGDYGLKICSSP